jgi:hypothetical protein
MANNLTSQLVPPFPFRLKHVYAVLIELWWTFIIFVLQSMAWMFLISHMEPVYSLSPPTISNDYNRFDKSPRSQGRLLKETYLSKRQWSSNQILQKRYWYLLSETRRFLFSACREVTVQARGEVAALASTVNGMVGLFSIFFFSRHDDDWCIKCGAKWLLLINSGGFLESLCCWSKLVSFPASLPPM